MKKIKEGEIKMKKKKEKKKSVGGFEPAATMVKELSGCTILPFP